MGQYTSKENSVMNSMYDVKSMRSASPPLMMAGVMTANFIWNTTRIVNGVVLVVGLSMW